MGRPLFPRDENVEVKIVPVATAGTAMDAPVAATACGGLFEFEVVVDKEVVVEVVEIGASTVFPSILFATLSVCSETVDLDCFPISVWVLDVLFCFCCRFCCC